MVEGKTPMGQNTLSFVKLVDKYSLNTDLRIELPCFVGVFRWKGTFNIVEYILLVLVVLDCKNRTRTVDWDEP
jgi:hypothetical protein